MTAGGSHDQRGKGAGENTGARLGGEMQVQEQEHGLYAGEKEGMFFFKRKKQKELKDKKQMVQKELEQQEEDIKQAEEKESKANNCTKKKG